MGSVLVLHSTKQVSRLCAARLLATGEYASAIPDAEGWLIHLSIEQHLLQFGALLAPVLAGPLGSFLLAPLDLVDQ